MTLDDKTRWSKGRGYRKYCYTLLDIAELKGVPIKAVRSAVARGVLDPADIKSVSAYLKESTTKEGD